jgi:hypothetical protein
MDEETEKQIAPEIAEYPEAGPYWVGLWAVARHWVALLAHIFEPDLLATPGITRRFALRCRNWLWPIEGLLRRLIIAAAMKLDVSLLPDLIAGRKKPATPRKPAPSVPFVVLPSLPGRGVAGRQPQAAACTARPAGHRHLLFPGDDLLRLFPRHAKRNAPRIPWRNFQPLKRRGRRSRWNPDYRCDSISEQQTRRLFSAFRERLDRREPRGRTPPDPSSRYAYLYDSDLPEWQRVEREWERVIPAPRIAGRIMALVRVMQAPERWIERTARRLTADLQSKLRTLPPPKLRKPKLDRSPSGFLAEQLGEAHAVAFADTS